MAGSLASYSQESEQAFMFTDLSETKLTFLSLLNTDNTCIIFSPFSQFLLSLNYKSPNREILEIGAVLSLMQKASWCDLRLRLGGGISCLPLAVPTALSEASRLLPSQSMTLPAMLIFPQPSPAESILLNVFPTSCPAWY